MALFKRIFHVCLFCNDINKSIEFYKALGAELAFDMKEEGDTEGWNFYMKIAEGEYIELQPVNSPNPHPHPEVATYYENQTTWHFSLETDDLAEVIETLIARGITVYQFPDPGAAEVHGIQDAILCGDGCFAVWVKDPDGTPIELMEQTGHSLQRRADKRFAKEGIVF